MWERGGEDLAAGSGDGNRKSEAGLGAITEEELTEVGAEGGLQGKSEIQGCAQQECWSHQPKQSSVEGDWPGEKCLLT